MRSCMGKIYDKNYINGIKKNKEVVYMSISYNRLCKPLIDKNKKVDLLVKYRVKE